MLHKVAVDPDRDVPDHFENPEDSEIHLKENQSVKIVAGKCFVAEIETSNDTANKVDREILDGLEDSQNMKRCAEDKNNLEKECENGKKHISSGMPVSCNGNSTYEKMDDGVSVHGNYSCFFDGLVKKVNV